jgi:hypothetical protein
MKRYKIVGTSKPEFMGIDISLVFDDISIGKSCEVFGYTFTITQTGMVLILSNSDWVLTLQELPPTNEDLWTETITDIKDLRINHEVDLFFKPKELMLTSTERIENHGVTHQCLFEFLKNEWQFVSHLTDIPFPFDFNYEFDLLMLNDEWKIVGDITLLRKGSFSRYASDGRCI